MTKEPKFRRISTNLATMLFRVAHGSFLTTGIVAAILIVGTMAGARSFGNGATDPIYELGREFRILASSPVAASDDGEAQVTLDDSMRAVANYVAHRYHVSALAVEPLILAAQNAGITAGVDPLLVIAVIGVESGFNPLSKSVGGAEGLMQVIAKYHAEKVDTRTNPLALIDPVTNIQVGVQVLQESILRAGGVEAGLQQYNGAADDPDHSYANKVLAEKHRLEQVSRRGRVEVAV